MAMGGDLVAVAREAMLAIGCIQAQRCHTGHCPAGITTHSRWLTRGLDSDIKGDRLARYVRTLRHELLELSHACGVVHPALVDRDRIEILDGNRSRTVASLFDYRPTWGRIPDRDQAELIRLMTGGGAARPSGRPPGGARPGPSSRDRASAFGTYAPDEVASAGLDEKMNRSTRERRHGQATRMDSGDRLHRRR
jgi:hypothetical protein